MPRSASLTRSSSGSGASGIPSPWGRMSGRSGEITHNDVEVVPTEAKPGIFPFWKAEDMSRAFHFSERILLFLERINNRLDDPSLRDELMHDYFLDSMGRRRADRLSQAAAGGDEERSSPPPPPARRAFRGPSEHVGHEAGDPPHPLGRPGQPALRSGPAGGLGGEVPLSPRDHRKQRLPPAHAPPRVFRRRPSSH